MKIGLSDILLVAGGFATCWMVNKVARDKGYDGEMNSDLGICPVCDEELYPEYGINQCHKCGVSIHNDCAVCCDGCEEFFCEEHAKRRNDMCCYNQNYCDACDDCYNASDVCFLCGERYFQIEYVKSTDIPVCYDCKYEIMTCELCGGEYTLNPSIHAEISRQPHISYAKLPGPRACKLCKRMMCGDCGEEYLHDDICTICEITEASYESDMEFDIGDDDDDWIPFCDVCMKKCHGGRQCKHCASNYCGEHVDMIKAGGCDFCICGACGKNVFAGDNKSAECCSECRKAFCDSCAVDTIPDGICPVCEITEATSFDGEMNFIEDYEKLKCKNCGVGYDDYSLDGYLTKCSCGNVVCSECIYCGDDCKEEPLRCEQCTQLRNSRDLDVCPICKMNLCDTCWGGDDTIVCEECWHYQKCGGCSGDIDFDIEKNFVDDKYVYTCRECKKVFCEECGESVLDDNLCGVCEITEATSYDDEMNIEVKNCRLCGVEVKGELEIDSYLDPEKGGWVCADCAKDITFRRKCKICGEEQEFDNTYMCNHCEGIMCDEHTIGCANYPDCNSLVCTECSDGKYCWTCAPCGSCEKTLEVDQRKKCTKCGKFFCMNCSEEIMDGSVCVVCQIIEVTSFDGEMNFSAKTKCPCCYKDKYPMEWDEDHLGNRIPIWHECNCGQKGCEDCFIVCENCDYNLCEHCVSLREDSYSPRYNRESYICYDCVDELVECHDCGRNVLQKYTMKCSLCGEKSCDACRKWCQDCFKVFCGECSQDYIVDADDGLCSLCDLVNAESFDGEMNADADKKKCAHPLNPRHTRECSACGMKYCPDCIDRQMREQGEKWVPRTGPTVLTHFELRFCENCSCGHIRYYQPRWSEKSKEDPAAECKFCGRAFCKECADTMENGKCALCSIIEAGSDE